MEENNENLENKVTELENKIMELEQQLSESELIQKEQHERFLRSEADFQNLKKRTEKEKEDTRKYSN
jgi:molecular chaperone GrpE